MKSLIVSALLLVTAIALFVSSAIVARGGDLTKSIPAVTSSHFASHFVKGH